MRSKIKELIDHSNSILLLTHETPDGDAVGSVLALYNYLISINKNVDMVILDIPEVFDFLPSINKVVDNTECKYDLGIVVDCSTRERIAQKEDLLSRCNNTIVIDHHISNTNFCDINYVKGDVTSCCEVVYSLFNDLNIPINREIGECLITGMLTDTNGFSIVGVNSKTFEMASKMIELGINIQYIYQKVLLNKTMPQYNHMKIGMERLEFLYDGKIAFTYILKDDFVKVGASLGEHEGIVNIGRNIDGVEVSIMMREDDGWNISLRSTGMVDVSKIASLFGGGGHKLASGVKVHGKFDKIKSDLIDEIIKVLVN